MIVSVLSTVLRYELVSVPTAIELALLCKQHGAFSMSPALLIRTCVGVFWRRVCAVVAIQMAFFEMASHCYFTGNS